MEKRYKEKPDKKIYTAQVMKLLDEYVIAVRITKTEAVNIRSWIWLIKYKILLRLISISILPFIKNFLPLINNTIIQHHNKRLSDSDLLKRVKKIRAEFKNDVPSELGTNKTIIASYRIAKIKISVKMPFKLLLIPMTSLSRK
ncbi:hypothetical protein [Rickettsia sibirica]|uniref:Uncharacterized protein n=1 Tax=Rickettsia sibirica (strain ATCC VR-151 / 246) TaxID=272951 RepID=Q7P909_RICS2|nr:hypothetical protein [Rickettsia sibirica]EAA26384.1 hypothetical protein rsib_orf1230 [Rickettsia sibirica 246]